jgi:hypothetical protein
MAQHKDVEPLSGIYLDAGRAPDPTQRPDYATPISLLANPQGQAAVLAVLTRLEHGVL